MPASGTVVIKEAHRAQILQHCRDARPNEGCGILAGRQGRVEKVYPTPNAEPENKAIRYEIHPTELLHIFQDIDELQLEFIGIFHSHVKSQAYPSSTDIRLSYYPDAIYFLISLQDEDAPVMRAFRIVKERPEDESGSVLDVELIVEP
jgi:proteasome lid subunit RPN8/RPN11